jgi:hypothetical protein
MMDFEKLDESKLNQLIMMEEFKLWDLKRNKVPQALLDETKERIKKLKEAKRKSFKNKGNR